jgi:TolB protein
MAHLQAGRWGEAVSAFEALAAQFPGDPAVAAALEQARLKQLMAPATTVRAKRWTANPRPFLVRGGIILALVVLGLLAWRVLQQQVRPAMQLAVVSRERAALLRDALAYVDAGDLDAAEAKLAALLAQDPAYPGAQEAQARVAVRRELVGLCADAGAADEAGDLVGARQKYQDALLRAGAAGELLPCDAAGRIAAINSQLGRDALFAEAEAFYAAGDCVQAMDRYRQVQQRDNNFQRDLIAGRLYDCAMRLGRAIIAQDPPVPEQVPAALDDFAEALAVRPRDPDAQTEQQLASLFLAGLQAYAAGNWPDAAARLGAAYDIRPGYMEDALLDPLYDALIRYGDQRRDVEDYYLAWEQYRRAAGLPVENITLARGRMAAVQPFLTPTPTPTDTPTATPPPTSTPIVFPTSVPSATPPAPLATYRNQIIYRSDKVEQPGFWVMNPDGSNRRYLGNLTVLQEQYKELYNKESLSPDGRYQVYTVKDMRRGNEYEQIYMKIVATNEVVEQLTDHAGTTYDPVWSPDGSRIAYVSQELTSDDIWTMNLDDRKPWNRTPNQWEWDKRPSWSPDSSKIVFWTNREGTKQIYIMDAEGRVQQNISNVPWDEYDPIWVK